MQFTRASASKLQMSSNYTAEKLICSMLLLQLHVTVLRWLFLICIFLGISNLQICLLTLIIEPRYVTFSLSTLHVRKINLQLAQNCCLCKTMIGHGKHCIKFLGSTRCGCSLHHWADFSFVVCILSKVANKCGRIQNFLQVFVSESPSSIAGILTCNLSVVGMGS